MKLGQASSAVLAVLLIGEARAALPPPASVAVASRAPATAPRFGVAPGAGDRKATLNEQLVYIRSQVLTLERAVIESARNQADAKTNVKRIQQLLKLQKEEKIIGEKRVEEIEKTIGELQIRRGELKEKVLVQQRGIRKALSGIRSSLAEESRTLDFVKREAIDAPKRRILANLVNHSIKELEALKVDLIDVEQLSERIQVEQGQLAYMFHDLQEKQSVLEFNQKLQSELIQQKHAERIAQLESFRKLKTAEVEVDRMLTNLNARRELQRTMEQERIESRFANSLFAKSRGKLPMPLSGRIVSVFGPQLDPVSKLQVFKKGVEIQTQTGKKMPVLAIAPGKIAYSGELPRYGRVTIVDHGDHFYSLVAQLGELRRKVGEAVSEGDAVGATDPSGTPVYFEIRAKNIAVNPLQWVAN